MNTTIFKYKMTSDRIISMPSNAKILKAGIQNDCIVLWALVDPLVNKNQRIFDVYGTGHEIRNDFNYQYIDTVIDGSFVWHIFERVL